MLAWSDMNAQLLSPPVPICDDLSPESNNSSFLDLAMSLDPMLVMNTELSGEESMYSPPMTPDLYKASSMPIMYNFMPAHAELENQLVSIPRIASAHKKSKSVADSDGVFPCTFEGCNKTFSKQYNLRSHLRIHYVPKSHSCSHCEATFRRSHDLRRHERSHESIKPFSCFKCMKSFTRADALKRHHSRVTSTCYTGM